MRRKITLNKNNNKYICGRLNIPKDILESIGINEGDRDVILHLEDGRLIIEKVKENSSNSVDENWSVITQEEKDCLLG